MLDSLLFPIRRRLPQIGRFLGSWKLSVVLMIVIALYYGFLAIWAASSPPDVVQRIASLLPFWAAYALLLVNTGVCLWRRFPVLKRDLRVEPAAVKTPARWGLETRAGMSRDEAKTAMRKLGYGHVRDHGSGIWGLRQRWASLGTYLFHGSFFLLVLAVALTMLARHEEKIWVAVGEEYAGTPDQILSVTHPRIFGLRPPSPRFVVESISPEFWGGEFLFTELSADLAFPGGEREMTRINRPLWRGWWTFLRLSGFGYAPRYSIADREGRELESAFVKMNVFPPGQSDFFTPDQFPHRISVEVLPDAVEMEAELTNRSLNLVEPAVMVRVTRGHVWLGEGLIRDGESFGFEGLALSFPEIRYWGEFSVVHDPGVPMLFFAFAISIIGLALKIRGGRSEVLWTPGEEGEAGRLEFWGQRGHVPGEFASIRKPS